MFNSNTQGPDLATLVSAGNCLIDSKSPKSSPHLKSVLQSRLAKFYANLGLSKCSKDTSSLEEVELETAQEALYIVERVQHLLAVTGDDPNLRVPGDSHVSSNHLNATAPAEVQVMGTRDLSTIRTLLSIVFRWGVEPLLVRVASVSPSTEVHPSCTIIDLTTTPDDYHLLSSFLSRLAKILFPSGASHSSVPHTQVTAIILNRHVTDGYQIP